MTAMAAVLWHARAGTGERGRTDVASGGLRDAEQSQTRTQRGRGADARVGNGGGELTHGCHAQATRHPSGRFRKHLAGDGVASVEHIFGMSTS